MEETCEWDVITESLYSKENNSLLLKGKEQRPLEKKDVMLPFEDRQRN